MEWVLQVLVVVSAHLPDARVIGSLQWAQFKRGEGLVHMFPRGLSSSLWAGLVFMLPSFPPSLLPSFLPSVYVFIKIDLFFVVTLVNGIQ